MAAEQPPRWDVPTSNYSFGDGVPNIRVGEIYGLRTFGVTEEGWLTGIMYPEPWTPETNEAKCWRVTAWEGEGGVIGTAPHHPWRARINGSTESPAEYAWVMFNDAGEKWYSSTKPKPIYGGNGNPEHNLADCKCGLHGFLEGSLDYSWKPGSVSGVVKAWGKMALGDRGFRAQYARVVALYIPDGAIDAAGGFRSAAVPAYWTRGLTNWGDEVKRTAPEPEVLDKVRERYGSLPVFRSLEALLDKYPTTPPPPREGFIMPEET